MNEQVTSKSTTTDRKNRLKSVKIRDISNKVGSNNTMDQSDMKKQRDEELQGLKSTLKSIAVQLLDFFTELKTKIYQHKVARSNMLNSFLDTNDQELKEYVNRDPKEFLQILESIVLVHMDKLADYKGPKFITEDFMNGGVAKKEENSQGRSKATDVVFRSKYSNMTIKKRKGTGGKEDAGNKQLYDLVFSQEVESSQDAGEGRRVLRCDEDCH